MVKEIPLQNGMVALVDDEDYERVNQYNWNVMSHDGVQLFVSRSYFVEDKRKSMSLGRYLLDSKELTDRDIVNHANNDKLDFRKENLRVLKREKISQISRGRKNTSSKYKGVSWCKNRKKWVANITSQGNRTRLGAFIDEDEAAMVYNRAALELFGEYAFQNSIGKYSGTTEYGAVAGNQPRRKNGCKLPRGVSEVDGGFTATIQKNKEIFYLGFYSDAEEAAKAYDKKAIELHGDKAILNFPEEVQK